jgi:hypothetical protein
MGRNSPKRSIVNKAFRGGKDTPQEHLTLVEQAGQPVPDRGVRCEDNWYIINIAYNQK